MNTKNTEGGLKSSLGHKEHLLHLHLQYILNML